MPQPAAAWDLREPIMATISQQELEDLIAGEINGEEMEQAFATARARMEPELPGGLAAPGDGTADAFASAGQDGESSGQQRDESGGSQPTPERGQSSLTLAQTPFWLETFFVAARLIPLWAFLIALVTGIANGVELLMSATRAIVILLVIGMACWGFTHYMSAFFAQHFAVGRPGVTEGSTQSWEA